MKMPRYGEAGKNPSRLNSTKKRNRPPPSVARRTPSPPKGSSAISRSQMSASFGFHMGSSPPPSGWRHSSSVIYGGTRRRRIPASSKKRKKMVTVVRTGIVAWTFGLLLTTEAAAAVSSSECLECPAEVDPDVPHVTAADLVGSVHDGLDCVDCHAAITELPHDEKVAPVACGSCHADEAAVYVNHGRAKVGVDPDIPTCAGCHGTHRILPSSDAKSRVNPRNLPDTCGRCHRDTNLAKAHDIKLKRPVEVYEASVHGRATLRGGVDFAATCNDCHSTGGTAHRILGPGDPLSSINHFNIPKTCGKCH